MNQSRSIYVPLPVVVLSFLLVFNLSGCPAGSGEQTHSQKPQMTSRTQVTQALGRDFQSISQGVMPVVVSISVTEREAGQRAERQTPWGPQDPDERQGSGVIVDARQGYILTNHHVIADAEVLSVSVSGGNKRKARVVGTDPPTDLAVIQIDPSDRLKEARLGDSDKLRVGEWVLAIGSPFGLESTVTAGIISAKSRADIGVADFEDFLQTDAAINPGNSGGPLVNIRGEVIGINTAIVSREEGYMGIGFAIPSNLARQVMQALIQQGRVIRSQLGIMIGPADELIRKGLGLPPESPGILVMDVFPGTPAALAGLRKYDLLLTLNGAPVTEVQLFRNQIALTPPGTTVTLEILRDGQRRTIKPLLKEARLDSSGRIIATERPEILKKLGLEVQFMDEALRARLQLPAGVTGILVTAVQADKSAYQQGLRVGDLITEVNQKSVQSLSAFYQVLQSARSGQVLLMNIIRDEQSLIRGLRLP